MRKKSAKPTSDSEAPVIDESEIDAQRLDDEPLGDVHFAEYTAQQTMSDEYQSKSVRFFFSEEPLSYDDVDLEEEDDFDDEFDEDFEVLSDDEFRELIDGDEDDEDSDDDSESCVETDFDDFDSMNSDENVYESDDDA